MPNAPVQINMDDLVPNNIKPEEAMQAQIAGIFQQANFFGSV